MASPPDLHKIAGKQPGGHLRYNPSYDAAVGGTVVNQVYQGYNHFGQVIQDVQDHDGATFNAPQVAYDYNDTSTGNFSRLTRLVYADGYELYFDYNPPVDAGLSRLSGISDATGSLTSYSYLGLGAIVQALRPQNGTALSYIKQPGESDGDVGDQYTGLDRFGRVVDQRWINVNTSADTDRYQYGYDQGSRRTYRENLVESTFSELYAYDELNQLAGFQRGTLNSTKNAINGTPTRAQSWTQDATGNWTTVTNDGVLHNRQHNAQNEITVADNNSSGFAYSANGNLTNNGRYQVLIYDAWNRLVRVDDHLGNVLEAYEYDALGRRIEETADGVTRDLYYSGWQVIEERVNGVTDTRYVRGLGYIDSFVLRDRDTNGDGTLDERLYLQQDANFNVTALVDVNGNVVERYAYDPFGVRSVYDASWSAVSGSAVAWVYGHQGLRHNLVVGLIENRMRVYDPDLGRFVQMDPIGFGAGDVNWYRYVGNGPTNGRDPSGLDGTEYIDIGRGFQVAKAENGRAWLRFVGHSSWSGGLVLDLGYVFEENGRVYVEISSNTVPLDKLKEELRDHWTSWKDTKYAIDWVKENHTTDRMSTYASCMRKEFGIDLYEAINDAKREAKGQFRSTYIVGPLLIVGAVAIGAGCQMASAGNGGNRLQGINRPVCKWVDRPASRRVYPSGTLFV